MIKQFKNLKLMPQIVLATLITIFIVAGVTSATTIGTNISTDGSLTVTGTTTIDSGVFYVDPVNDKVGIGTTTPQFKLDINGDVNIGSSSSYKIGGYSFLGGSIDDFNTYIGINTGDFGSGNTLIGINTGFSITNGSSNTFVGEQSGSSNTSGFSNVFIGSLAGDNNVSGVANTYLGTNAGILNTAGSNNVFLGYAAGEGSGGSGNIFLGNRAGYYATGSNKLYISNSTTAATSTLIYGEFDNNILSFNANVGIGTTTPQEALHVYNDTAANIFIESDWPGIILKQNDQAVDNKIWSFSLEGNNLYGQIQSDSMGSAANWLQVTRSGMTPTSINFNFVTTHVGGLLIKGNASPQYNSMLRLGDTTTMMDSLISFGDGNSDNHWFLGTDYDDQAKLKISTSTNLLQAEFTVDKNGNVGIGTTSPEANLQVFGGDTATSTVEIGGATSNKGACLKLRDSDGAGWSYCTILDGTLSCSQTSCE